jgi:hypothetical protein
MHAGTSPESAILFSERASVMVQLPERISRLEGACERVADRLNGIDAKLTILDQKMDVRFDAVDRKI